MPMRQTQWAEGIGTGMQPRNWRHEKFFQVKIIAITKEIKPAHEAALAAATAAKEARAQLQKDHVCLLVIFSFHISENVVLNCSSSHFLSHSIQFATV